MKKEKKFDVDFIGGQEPLTKEEEKALADYFKLKATKEKLKSKIMPKSKK
jgi:hypothetical protein